MKFVTIFGARAQFVKAATACRIIRACDDITRLFIDAGQHREAIKAGIFFEILNLSPNDQLGIDGGAR